MQPGKDSNAHADSALVALQVAYRCSKTDEGETVDAPRGGLLVQKRLYVQNCCWPNLVLIALKFL